MTFKKFLIGLLLVISMGIAFVLGRIVSLDDGVDIVKSKYIEIKEMIQIAMEPELPGPREKMGYIKNINVDSLEIEFDEIEWLTQRNEKRLKDLGIDMENDMPNGFYIYNGLEEITTYKLHKQAEFGLMNFSNEGAYSAKASLSQIAKKINSEDEYFQPYLIIINEGIVESITEQYLP